MTATQTLTSPYFNAFWCDARMPNRRRTLGHLALLERVGLWTAEGRTAGGLPGAGGAELRLDQGRVARGLGRDKARELRDGHRRHARPLVEQRGPHVRLA